MWRRDYSRACEACALNRNNEIWLNRFLFSPLAPKIFATLAPLAGVRLAATNCGIRYTGRPDVLLVELAEGTQVAGVFTRSLTASAPVEWCRRAIKNGAARALVVNAGNSNAFTGKAGDASVWRCMESVAKIVGCPVEETSMASTGVIGELLPDAKITQALPALYASLRADAWHEAAQAIMTTDTFPKAAMRKTHIARVEVTLQGIAKGSGMIAPDMATMLAFIFTDARITAPALQAMLNSANARSFNAITVDSDTSTSDTALLFATGKANHPLCTNADAPELQPFREALESLMTELAQMIVRDGEGATKFVTVTVTGAADDAAAKRIALSIGNSPLVKTAIAGEDANWGRIVMAVGKAGERADRDGLAIRIGGIAVAEQGAAVVGYDETPVVLHMKGQDILIEVDVGIAKGKATIWTCDLTHGYIDINGSYRS